MSLELCAIEFLFSCKYLFCPTHVPICRISMLQININRYLPFHTYLWDFLSSFNQLCSNVMDISAQNMTNASTMNTAEAAPRQYVSTYLGLTCITKRRKSCCFWCVGQTWLMRWQLQTNYANNHCLRLKSLTLFWFSQLTVCVLHQQQLRKTAWWFSLSLSLTL